MPVVFATSQPTFTRPATYYIPCGTGYDAMRFTVDFKILPGTELTELRERFTKGELTQDDVLDMVVHGWKGLKDASGAEVPYSIAERKATEVENPGFEQSIAIAYFDAVSPHQREAAELAKEAAKNSVAPSVTTTA